MTIKVVSHPMAMQATQDAKPGHGLLHPGPPRHCFPKSCFTFGGSATFSLASSRAFRNSCIIWTDVGHFLAEHVTRSKVFHYVLTVALPVVGLYPWKCEFGWILSCKLNSPNVIHHYLGSDHAFGAWHIKPTTPAILSSLSISDCILYTQLDLLPLPFFVHRYHACGEEPKLSLSACFVHIRIGKPQFPLRCSLTNSYFFVLLPIFNTTSHCAPQ